MDPNRPNLNAGQRLRAARERVGLSTRDVQRKSEQIAVEKKNQEYYLSHAWLTDIEQGKFMPGLFKLYSISAIYDKSFTEIASYFGLRIADLGRDRASIGVPKTHLVDREGDAEVQNVSLPVEFKPEFRFETTNLLARVVEKWTTSPSACFSTSTCANPCTGTLGSKTQLFIRSSGPGRWYRSIRARKRSARGNGEPNSRGRSTSSSCGTDTSAVGAS